MGTRKKSGAKAFIIFIIVLVIIIGGIAGIFYYLAKKLVFEGNILNGGWTSSAYTVKLEADEKTYVITPTDADDDAENGTIDNLEYDKSKSGDKVIIYNATFKNDADSYDVVLTINEDKTPMELTISSEYFENDIVLSQVDDTSSN